MIYQTESPATQNHPLHAFQKLTESQLDKLRNRLEEQDEEEEEKENLILCRNCRNRITSADNGIFIDGLHRHVFSNPYGIVFEIGCFGSAEGCLNRGMSTTEFSWFEGFSWRYAICSRCHVHLGWYFQSRGTESFYGLILNNLVEGI